MARPKKRGPGRPPKHEKTKPSRAGGARKAAGRKSVEVHFANLAERIDALDMTLDDLLDGIAALLKHAGLKLAAASSIAPAEDAVQCFGDTCAKVTKLSVADAAAEDDDDATDDDASTGVNEDVDDDPGIEEEEDEANLVHPALGAAGDDDVA